MPDKGETQVFRLQIGAGYVRGRFNAQVRYAYRRPDIRFRTLVLAAASIITIVAAVQTRSINPVLLALALTVIALVACGPAIRLMLIARSDRARFSRGNLLEVEFAPDELTIQAEGVNVGVFEYRLLSGVSAIRGYTIFTPAGSHSISQAWPSEILPVARLERLVP